MSFTHKKAHKKAKPKRAADDATDVSEDMTQEELRAWGLGIQPRGVPAAPAHAARGTGGTDAPAKKKAKNPAGEAAEAEKKKAKNPAGEAAEAEKKKEKKNTAPPATPSGGAASACQCGAC